MILYFWGFGKRNSAQSIALWGKDGILNLISRGWHLFKKPQDGKQKIWLWLPSRMSWMPVALAFKLPTTFSQPACRMTMCFMISIWQLRRWTRNVRGQCLLPHWRTACMKLLWIFGDGHKMLQDVKLYNVEWVFIQIWYIGNKINISYMKYYYIIDCDDVSKYECPKA